MKKDNKIKGLCRFDKIIEDDNFKLRLETTTKSRNYYWYWVTCYDNNVGNLLDLIYSKGYDIPNLDIDDLWSDVVSDKPFTILLTKPLDLNNPNWKDDAKLVA